MTELLRERLTTWGARLGFAALLLVCSEWIVWQTPTGFSALEWLGLAVVYLALAGLTLDLVARFAVEDVFGLLLVAGLYGLLNATLISHITARDLPLSLVVRPLGAQPLACVLALTAFQVLASGRATGPVDLGAALGAGLVWGVWLRWFPEVSDEALPAAEIGPAVGYLALLLLACLLIRFAVPPTGIYRREDWQLTPPEWFLVVMTLLAAAAVAIDRDDHAGIGLAITLMLGGYAVLLLVIHGRYFPRAGRPVRSVLASLTPPRRPNPAAWLAVVVPFLALGWVGFHLPGDGTRSVQSDVLFGALTAVGIVWLPAVSTVYGVRAFVQLTREGF
jgi:hypothetical protein